MKLMAPLLNVLLLMCVCYLCNAQQQTDKQFLHQYAASNVGKGTPEFYIARLNPEMEASKSGNGFKILRRLSGNMAIISITDSNLFNREKASLSELLPANNNWKLSPKLSNGRFKNGKYTVTLLGKRIESSKNLNPFSGYGNTFVINGNAERINQLLADEHVLFIDAFSEPKTELVLNGMDMSTNKVTAAHHIYPGINGEGLTVSIKENLFDTTDVDFAKRYVANPLSSSTIESHASIMGTIIGGAGNSYYTGKGVAWKSKLTSSDFANILPDADEDYTAYNISVQNHSYGTAIENYYGADAAAYDESAVNNPALLHIFSSGNAGDKASDTGNYKGISGYANLTGNFKMGKNIITVGSIDSFYHVLPLSSKGPAYDGRIKPELVAYGTDGSSGAAAIVSGTSLLLQQAYKNSTNSLPPASLVKAILLNSADDVGAKYMDYQGGFGSVNTLRALDGITSKRWRIDSVDNAAEKTYNIQIPANTQQLKVMLCWTDSASTVNSYKALVNDLDLEVINNSTGEIFLPYVLNSFPAKDSLEQLPRRMRDSLNNTEQVIIENMAAGEYTIRVKGYDITGNAQPFSVAWQWDTINHFSWLYPTKDDNLFAGQKNTIRWQSNYNNAQNNLEVTYDKGSNWTTLNNNININAGYYNSTIKDSFCLGQLRMRIDNKYFYSDTFTISKRLNTGVGYNCADSFLLYWQKAKGISQYHLYDLRDTYLETNTIVNDTSIVLSKTGNPVYFAVAPVIENWPGINSYGFDYTTQGVECYLKNFLADLLPPDKASLNIELGSNTGIQSISIQKLTGQSLKNLQIISPVNNLSYDFTDDSLSQGLNNYRLQILLTNGKAIYSDIQTVSYFNKADFIVFPNPAAIGQTIKILSKELNDNVLEMYSSTGQKVLQTSLVNLYNEVSIASLARGIYFYTIRQNGKIINKGKLLIQ